MKAILIRREKSRPSNLANNPATESMADSNQPNQPTQKPTIINHHKKKNNSQTNDVSFGPRWCRRSVQLRENNCNLKRKVRNAKIKCICRSVMPTTKNATKNKKTFLTNSDKMSVIVKKISLKLQIQRWRKNAFLFYGKRKLTWMRAANVVSLRWRQNLLQLMLIVPQNNNKTAENRMWKYCT